MNSKIHFLKVGKSEIFFKKESKINCVFTALSSPGSCSSRLVLVWLLLFSLTVNIPRLLEYQVRLHTTHCCFTVMHYQVQLVRHTTPNTNQAPAHTPVHSVAMGTRLLLRETLLLALKDFPVRGDLCGVRPPVLLLWSGKRVQQQLCHHLAMV